MYKCPDLKFRVAYLSMPYAIRHVGKNIFYSTTKFKAMWNCIKFYAMTKIVKYNIFLLKDIEEYQKLFKKK
jgi:hypothetical protein